MIGQGMKALIVVRHREKPEHRSRLPCAHELVKVAARTMRFLARFRCQFRLFIVHEWSCARKGNAFRRSITATDAVNKA